MKILLALLLIPALCLVSATAAAQTDHPVLYYSFETVDSVNIPDDSGNFKTGSGHDITFEKGKVGNAAVFIGSASISVSLNKMDSFTAAFFLKCPSIASSGGQIFGNTAWENNTVHLVYGYNGLGLRANFNGFVNADSSVTDTAIQVDLSDMEQYDGQWIHIALTYDNTSFERTLYINGSAVCTDKGVQALSGTINGEFIIGAWNADRFFTGMLDEFRIYDRAITPNEVSALAAQDGEALVSPQATVAEQTEMPSREITQAPVTTEPQTSQTQDAEPSPSQIPWLWIIGCIAVIVLAIIVFLIAKRPEKSHDNQETD